MTTDRKPPPRHIPYHKLKTVWCFKSEAVEVMERCRRDPTVKQIVIHPDGDESRFSALVTLRHRPDGMLDPEAYLEATEPWRLCDLELIPICTYTEPTTATPFAACAASPEGGTCEREARDRCSFTSAATCALATACRRG